MVGTPVKQVLGRIAESSIAQNLGAQCLNLPASHGRLTQGLGGSHPWAVSVVAPFALRHASGESGLPWATTGRVGHSGGCTSVAAGHIVIQNLLATW